MYIAYLVYFSCSLFTQRSDAHKLGIIGGRNTTIAKHPYQVSLTIFDDLACSGVVLNEKWVLTTASCISGVRYSPDEVSIRAASSDYSSGGTVYTTEAIFMHEQFTYFTQDYDVAVLKINEKFKFGKTLKPIKLGSKRLKTGTKAVISGWGATNGSFYVHNIKEDDVNVLKTSVCANVYTALDITSNMFCAGSKDYGPCWVDDADPLVVKNRVYGLLSFNNGCYNEYYPSVYTNIPNLRKWITTTIKTTTMF